MPKKKALIISVSDYDDKSIHSLPFCKTDGEKMSQLLQKIGFEITENNKITGKIGWQTMCDTLSDFFTPGLPENRISSKDTLLFYFSGHGLVHNDKFYLATSEMDPLQPYRRGIEESFLKTILDECPSKKIVLILDSCHSGKFNPFAKGDNNSAASIATDSVNKMDMAEGRFLLAACKGSQESIGSQDGSKFTKYVMDALDSNKDSVDRNGNVTPSSLAKYVDNEMRNNPEQDGVMQIPIIKVEGSSDIILAHYDEFKQQESDSSEMNKKIQDLQKLEKIRDKAFEFHDRGMYEDAIPYYDQALEISPNDVKVLLYKGLAHHNLGEYDEAISCYDKLLEMNPDDEFALRQKNYATSLRESGIGYDPPKEPRKTRTKEEHVQEQSGNYSQLGDIATRISIPHGSGKNDSCVNNGKCFIPSIMVVQVGTSITWTNDDIVGHTITSGLLRDDKIGTIFDSDLIPAGKSFSHTFTKKGNFKYFCMIHPWQVGEIVVNLESQDSEQTQSKIKASTRTSPHGTLPSDQDMV